MNARAFLISASVSLRLTALAGGLVLLAGFSGCAVGPEYKTPAATTAPLPSAFAGNTNDWKVAAPQAHLPKDKWWEIFGDPTLNGLEIQAAGANQELKAAFARFEQARASVNVAKADLYPNLSVAGSATRNRDSSNRPENGVRAGKPNNYSNFTIPLDLSYEFDLWGRVRKNVQAANARLQADAADLESVKLSIQAEVATDYFALRTLDAERALLVKDVASLQQALELTRNRRAGGIATDLDVSQAETLLKTIEAQLPSVALQRARLEHAIALLTGQPATVFSLPERPLDLTPPPVPVGLPSELLERRPDVASAERLMAVANANVGIAQTAFYPSVRFNGMAGLNSLDIGTLFNWPSRMWAVGPSLSVPLFEGGRNRANLAIAKAAYEETVAQYRQSVLVAFNEVEDNLTAQGLLTAQTAAQTAALLSAKRTLEIASNRYHSGLVTYLEVSTAQTAAIEQEREVVRLQGQQLVAAVSLVKSLGGGWQKPVAASGTSTQTSAK